MRKPIELSVKINHNYTISVLDSAGRAINFRDIKGKDLEFLEHLLAEGSDNDSSSQSLTFEQVVLILNKLSVEKMDFSRFPKRIISGVFNCVKEHILCNYMPKHSWLVNCYSIQNGSFQSVLEMEEVPMNKFAAMVQIHKEAVDAAKVETG